MSSRSALGVVALSWAGLSLVACSDSGDPPLSNGGRAGSSSPGGASGSGGSSGADASTSGGTAGAQGAGTGGSAGAGAAAGSSGTTGASGTAGSAGTGGGGSAGNDSGAGTGGTSSGCGKAEWPASGEKTIDVAGTSRTYIVTIPSAYASSTPHRLVFAWHGLGGTAQQIASGFRGGYYGLQNLSGGTTIFVAGQGLATSGDGGAGWPNTSGRDVAFVRALLDLLRQSYCIDESRIFSVGMSYGGIMSNTLGCDLGDVFRAIAPMSGSGPRLFGGRTCAGQVAVWMSHGNTDTVVPFAQGQASRDYWVSANHCEAQTMPAMPAPCVAYQGCDDGHPVTWCEFDGGHTVPTFASQAIWSFLSQF